MRQWQAAQAECDSGFVAIPMSHSTADYLHPLRHSLLAAGLSLSCPLPEQSAVKVSLAHHHKSGLKLRKVRNATANFTTELDHRKIRESAIRGRMAV